MEWMDYERFGRSNAPAVSASPALKLANREGTALSGAVFGTGSRFSRFDRFYPFSGCSLWQRILWLLVFSAAVAASAFAQPIQAPAAQPGNISGTVTDAEGDVIADATVTLQAPGGQGPRLW